MKMVAMKRLEVSEKREATKTNKPQIRDPWETRDSPYTGKLKVEPVI